MAELRMTPARVALLRAIAGGELSVSRSGDQVLSCWLSGQLQTGRRMANTFHELANAVLVRKVPFFFEGRRPARLTLAGEELLTRIDAADTIEEN